MTKKHSTKRSLIASILVLCLCLTSFIGTTFAWFTDSVTSGNNIIKSGKLDIEMYWAQGTEDPTNANWKDASTGAIFDYDNWEPGYVEVRHIKIANEGTLALKYKVNIVANGEITDLADVIDVYYVDPAIQVVDRVALANAPKLGTLTEVLAGLGDSGNGTLAKGTADTITIAFMMQESAGNEYMNKSIGSSFSIQLVATQLASENDSFDNQYDADAAYPKLDYATKEENSSATIGDEGVKVEIPASAPAGDYEISVSNVAESIDDEGNTTVSMDIDLKKNGVKVESAEGVSYTVSINVGLGKIITGVTHNGQAISEYSYENGILTFTTDSFSPFAFTYCDDPAYGKVAMIGETYYETLEAALDAAVDGDTIALIADLTNPTYSYGGGLNIKKAITLDLGGKTITDGWIRFYADATIRNGYLKNVTKSSPIYVEKGTLTVANVAIEDSRSESAIYLRDKNTALNFDNSSILLTKGENTSTTLGLYAIYSTYDDTIVNIKDSTITVDAGTTLKGLGVYSSGKTTVNFNSGKISTSGSTYAYGIQTKGDVNVTGGEIVTNEKTYGYSNGITYGKNYAINAVGNVIISNAKITTYGNSGYIVYTGGSNQKITISNVEFTNVLSEIDKTTGGHSAPALIQASSANVVITSGTFNGFSAALVKGSSNTISVMGGTFDAKPSTIANGYEAVDNGNGTWTVSKAPSGKLHGSYISETTIWAECSANATESLVIKVYSGDTYLGSTSLNNIGGILNGNVAVTWHLSLDPASDGDEYWAQEWTVRPTKDLIPDRAVLYVDGKQVDERSIELNGPDNLNKIYAAIADEAGNIVRFCTSFPSIDDIPNGYTIIQLRDIDLNDFANMFG